MIWVVALGLVLAYLIVGIVRAIQLRCIEEALHGVREEWESGEPPFLVLAMAAVMGTLGTVLFWPTELDK